MAQYKIGKGIYEIPDDISEEKLHETVDFIQEHYEDTRQTDLGYGIDQMQKNMGFGLEALGDVTGWNWLEGVGTKIAERNEESLKLGRWSPDQVGSFLDQEGVANKLKWIGENVTTNAPSSGMALVGGLASAFIAPLSVPASFVIGLGTLGAGIIRSTGEAASETKEKTGTYDSAIAVGTGTIVAFLDRFGAGKVIPKEKLASMSGEQIMKELTEKGYGSAAKEFAKEVGKAARTEAITELGQESLIVGQSMLQGGQYTGKELIDRGVDSLILGSTFGAGFRGGTEALNLAINGTQGEKISIAEQEIMEIINRGIDRNDPSSESRYNNAVQLQESINKAKAGDQKEANKILKFVGSDAANVSFAQRLQRLIQGGYKQPDGTSIPFNVQDVKRDSVNGARALIDSAHINISNEIKGLVSTLKERLSTDPKKSRSLDQLFEKIEASGALRHSRNKTKASLPADSFDAVANLVGDLQEGQMLLNLLRESQVLTEVHNADYVGGLSRYTDQLMPFGVSTGYDSGRGVANVARAALTAGGFMTGGLPVTMGQLGVVGAGRVLGSGSRSNVANFVNRNVGGQPMQVEEGLPSVLQQQEAQRQQAEAEAQQRQQQAQQKEQETQERIKQVQEANRMLGRKGASPTPTSPQGTLEDATGLDKSGVARALRILESLPSTNQALRNAIQNYRTSIDVGGRVPNLTLLIRAVNDIATKFPKVIPRTARPNTSAEQAYNQQVQIKQYQESANYARGVEANQKFASDLQKSVNEDRSLTPVEKAKIQDALYQLSLNLGRDPVGRLNEILSNVTSDVSPENQQKYIQPYAERVMQQQAKKPQDEEDRIVPVPFNNEAMQQRFGVTDPIEGGNYINLDDDNADVTGQSYSGGTISIIDGKGSLETNNEPSDPATKDLGWKTKVNLFKKSAGWKWKGVDRREETIVSTETRGKHYYSLSTDMKTPVTLETYPKQQSEPRLRPSTYGEATLGNVIGNITVRGKTHPVYDSVTIAPKNQQPKLTETKNVEVDQDLDNRYPNSYVIKFRNPTTPAPKRKLLDVGNILMEEQRLKYGRDLDVVNSNDDFNLVLDALSDEFTYQMDNNPQHLSWYDSDIVDTMKILESMMPELADPYNKEILLLMTALTSVGHKPIQNMILGADLMDHYLKTGSVGVIVPNKKDAKGRIQTRLTQPSNNELFGSKSGAIEGGLTIFGDMLNELGVEGALDYINGQHTKKELNQRRGKSINLVTGKPYGPQGDIKGKADSLHEGSYIFGPKVGAFFRNLKGIKDETIDLWATRAILGYTGGLLQPEGSKSSDPLVNAPTGINREAFKRLFQEVGKRYNVEPQQAQAVIWSATQNLYTDLGVKSDTQTFSQGAAEYKRRKESPDNNLGVDQDATPQAIEPILSEASRKPSDIGVLLEPDLSSPPVEISSEFTQASVDEARDILGDISSETPIRDMKRLTLLARAFNTDIVFVRNQVELDQARYDYSIPKTKSSSKFDDDSNGFFMRLSGYHVDEVTGIGKMIDGKSGIAVIKLHEGEGLNPRGVKTAFHEIAHALSLMNPDRHTYLFYLGGNNYTKANPVNRRSAKEYVYSNTFVEHFYNTITQKFDAYHSEILPSKRSKKYINELIEECRSVQNRTDFNTDIFTEKNKTPYRHSQSSIELDMMQDEVKRRKTRFDEIQDQLKKIRNIENSFREQLTRSRTTDEYAKYVMDDISIGAVSVDPETGERSTLMGPSLFNALRDAEGELFKEKRLIHRGKDPESSKGFAIDSKNKNFPKYRSTENLEANIKSYQKFVRGYLWNLREIIVDPIMFSITNPSEAKEQIPKFYELLQEYFNDPETGGPKFLALIMPMLNMMEQQGFGSQEMMGPGMLSLQNRGVLAV